MSARRRIFERECIPEFAKSRRRTARSPKKIERKSLVAVESLTPSERLSLPLKYWEHTPNER
jgi:hypothetical protein